MNRNRASVGAGMCVLLALMAVAGCGDDSRETAPRKSAGTTSTQPASSTAQERPATGSPSVCPSGATTPQTEGPYFTPNAPQKSDLTKDPGVTGEVIDLGGAVFDQGCKPLAGVRIDFWQSDDSGAYDNEGYTLRGHQLTDAAGAYDLRTIVPGEYTGRTEHIHVKISEPSGEELLTTQLYVPGASEAAEDGAGLFDADNLIEPLALDAEPARYRFDFRVG